MSGLNDSEKELVERVIMSSLTQRVADEYLKQAGVLDKLKKMFFKNKETGNKVKFESLPAKQKKELTEKAKAKEEKSEKKRPDISNPSKLSDEDLKSAIDFTKKDLKGFSGQLQKATNKWLGDLSRAQKEVKPKFEDFKKSVEPLFEEMGKRDGDQAKKLKEEYEDVVEDVEFSLTTTGGKMRYKEYRDEKKKRKSEKKSSLHSQIVRLAYQNPSLRADLLPLVRTKVAKSPRKKWENPNNGRSKVVYVEAILDNPQQLLNWWENNVKDYMGAGDPVPLLDTKVAHHMTIVYGGNNPGISLAEVEQMGIGGKVQLEVIGYDYSDKVQAVLVKPKGTTSSNRYPHITVAVGNGGKAADSNDLLARRNIKDVPSKLTLSATIGYFGRGKHHTQIDWENE